MKNLILLVTVLVAFFATSVFSAVAVIPIEDNKAKCVPANVRTVKLGTCNSGVYDTIKTGNSNIYGPINLSSGSSDIAFKTFRVFVSSGALSANDSLVVTYQLLPTNNIGDTCSSWLTADTLSPNERSKIVSVGDSCGVSLAVKFRSLIAGTILVKYPVRVVFNATASEFVDPK